MLALWYGHRQEKGEQIHCFIGKVRQEITSFFPRVGCKSDKVIAFCSFERLAHDNLRETRNQLQISNLCKLPTSASFPRNHFLLTFLYKLSVGN